MTEPVPVSSQLRRHPDHPDDRRRCRGRADDRAWHLAAAARDAGTKGCSRATQQRRSCRRSRSRPRRCATISCPMYPSRDRHSACALPARRTRSGENRDGEPGYVHHRRLRDRRRRAGDERRSSAGRRTPTPSSMGRRAGQRNHRSRPTKSRIRLVAAAPAPGLEPSGAPSPASSVADDATASMPRTGSPSRRSR